MKIKSKIIMVRSRAKMIRARWITLPGNSPKEEGKERERGGETEREKKEKGQVDPNMGPFFTSLAGAAEEPTSHRPTAQVLPCVYRSVARDLTPPSRPLPPFPPPSSSPVPSPLVNLVDV